MLTPVFPLYFWLTRVCLFIGLASASIASAAPLAPDNGFRAPLFAEAEPASRCVLLPNGKFVRFFNTDTLMDQRTGAITRYLPDGTLDSSFSFSRDYKFVAAAAPLPNGKLLVSATRYLYGVPTEQVMRLNGNGGIDSTFNIAILSPGSVPSVSWIAPQPDGKILITGFFETVSGLAHQRIVRLRADGTVDPTFTSPQFEFDSFGAPGIYSKPTVLADGKILIAGNFTRVNGVTVMDVARLNDDGSLDSIFQASGFAPDGVAGPITGLIVQNDGKIVLTSVFYLGTDKSVPLFRLNANGSPDTNYSYVSNLLGGVAPNDILLQPDGKVVIPFGLSVYRFNPNGSLDGSFVPPVLSSSARSVSLQPDGRILIGGSFTDVNPSGTPDDSRFGVARLNADGTLDSSLSTSQQTGIEIFPGSFTRLPDSSTFISFESISLFVPPVAFNFQRLLRDGSPDNTFSLSSSKPGSVLTRGFVAAGFTQLSDGNFFVFGETEDGAHASAKFLSNGQEDLAFQTDPAAPPFQSATQLPDNSILLVAGNDAESTMEGSLSRLRSDGGLDNTFQFPASIYVDQVLRDSLGILLQISVGSQILAVQPDGKILFSYLGTDQSFHLVRLNRDGSVDNSFLSTTLPSDDLVQTFPVVYDPVLGGFNQPLLGALSASPAFREAQVLPDGRILIGGQFTSFQGTPDRGVVRLNPNGTVDSTFAIGGGAQWTETTETPSFFPVVEGIALQDDGKLLIVGTFEAFNGTPLPGIGSLNSDGSVDTSFTPPAKRQKYARGKAKLARQADGSFLLSGPYSFPEENDPTFLHLLAPPLITSGSTASATKGQEFSYQIVAGGDPTSFDATGLPDGLTINTGNGLISGTPSAIGDFVVILGATNSVGTSTATLTLHVAPAVMPPVIICPLTATATIGQFFIYQIVATNQPTSLSASNLPAGLDFNSALGVISGQPSNAGVSSIGLSAINPGGSDNAILTLTTKDSSSAIRIINGPVTARTAEPLTFQILAEGIASSAVFSATGLPDGVSVNAITGLITGTPHTSGVFPVTLSVSDQGQKISVTVLFILTSDQALPVITSPDEETLLASQPFTYRISAPSTGDPGSGPTTFSIIGELPPGLSFDSTTGVISGTFTGSSAKAEKASYASDSGSSPARSVLGRVQLFATNSHGSATKTLVFITAVPQLLNISSRLNVLIGDNVLIGGFIVTGHAPKKVLLRAIGPSLKANPALAGALADPVLELHKPDGTIITNDNWKDSQQLAITATSIPPTDNKEAAIIATLDPVDPAVKGSGAYTAIVRGKDGGTGIGLIEVYDLDETADSSLTNLSTRGFVGVKNDVMIGGLIVGGANAQVLVRAIGPELSKHGVAGALNDTTLELHNQDGSIIAANDDWETTQKAAITATGIAPADKRESAVLMALSPGNYTAVVQGKNNATGVALVEVYNVSP